MKSVLLGASFFVLAALTSRSAALSQETSRLPSGKVGTPYEFRVQTEGGLPPLHWRLLTGDLPPGIELQPSGLLKGTPAVPRATPYEFTLEVADSSQPPQTASQRFSLLIQAAPLRIITKAPPLRIVPAARPPSPPAAAEPATVVPSARAPAEAPVPKDQALAYPSPAIHWVVPVKTQAAGSASSGTSSGAGRSGRGAGSSGQFDPAAFTRIFEDSAARNRMVLYEPVTTKPGSVSRLTADEESSIIIQPVPELMGNDLPLNKLFVTAELVSGGTRKKLEVIGYSEVGKDEAKMGAQAGMAFQTAENVQAMILNMAYTANDIITYVYGLSDLNLQAENVKQIDEAIQAEDENGPHLKRVKDRLRLYEPEINAIADFFVKPEHLTIVEKIGTQLFWVDRDSMARIAAQYRDKVRIALGDGTTPQARADALRTMFERTQLIYKDFGALRQDILTKNPELARTDLPLAQQSALWEAAIQRYARTERPKLFDALKKLFATGTVSLATNQAKDGDRLTLTVEARAEDGSASGIPAVFEILVRRYGAKVQLGSSFLYIRRLGVTDQEANPPTGSTATPINRVNFAPSPGVTFGVTYFKRGQTSWDKFARGLAPGIGLNVSFMNFNDPSFDQASGKFVNTNGTNVQVGAGLLGSLFDRKLQFSYGWNLNVDRRRTYFGVGFGFIEVAKELATYIKK